jgi:hypothetical protein
MALDAASSRPLALLDVEDTERLVNHVIVRSGLALRPHQHDELATFLIAECWKLSLRFERGRGSTTTFAGWAATNLRLRVVDWLRHEFGSSRLVHQRPEFLSLDDPDRDHLGSALGARDGDPAASCDPDLERLDAARNRERARDYETLGLGSNGRTARRDLKQERPTTHLGFDGP